MRKPFQLFRTVASFLFSLVLNLMAVVAGGFVWRGQYTVQVTTLVLAGSVLGGYLVWRVFIQKARLPHTRLGWVFGLGLGMGLLSAAYSPDPRLAWPRLALLGFYVLLFYILMDALETILDREAVLHGALVVGWFVVLLGVTELYAVYYGWFNAVGSLKILPPGPYRLSSILGHSNVLMPYINLLAPLALVALLKARRLAGRVIYIAWLFFYIVILPFSSSRGGWFGFFAWIGVLILFWIWKTGFRNTFGLVWGRRSWLARLVWLPVLAVVGYGGLRVWNYFSSHASHGSAGLFDNRIEIWKNALAIFVKHPWLGVGPGRFAYEYLGQNGNTPPAFWALHAHSLPIEVLAEFGMLGFGVLVLVSVVFIWLAWKRLRSVPPAQVDGYTGAALAGIASLGMHALVEDPTKVAPAMILLVLLAAWVLLPPGVKLPRWGMKEIETTDAPQGGGVDLHTKKWIINRVNLANGFTRYAVSLGALMVPGVVLLGFSAWSVWTYQPMAAAIPAVAENDWENVVRGITESANRDPQFVYYQVEAGLAWAQYWRTSQNPAALDLARAYLVHSLELEPAMSLIWADKAALDWQANDPETALQAIKLAAWFAPNDPAFLLNQASFEEETGQAQTAYSDYQHVLDLAPGWAGHSFFAVTPLRQQAMIDWVAKHPRDLGPGSAYWSQALQALQAGDLPAAELQAARSAWIWEDVVPRQRVFGMIQEAKGNPDGAARFYESVAGMSMNTYLVAGSPFVDSFNVWMNDRNGLLLDTVPGFLQIQVDQGQAEVLTKLNGWYRQQGKCEDAARVWEALQRFTYAGALQPRNPVPACPAGTN